MNIETLALEFGKWISYNTLYNDGWWYDGEEYSHIEDLFKIFKKENNYE